MKLNYPLPTGNKDLDLWAGKLMRELEVVFDMDSYTSNIFMGIDAGGGGNIAGAEYNTFFGNEAGYSLTSGDYNCGFGYKALYELTSGSYNIAMGSQAGLALTDSSYNTAIGNNSLAALTGDGGSNIAIGSGALRHATGEAGHMCYENTVVGVNAASSATGGYKNVYIGFSAALGASATTPEQNVVIGYMAGYDLRGSENVIIGSKAGYELKANGYNVLIGVESGENITSSLNALVGYKAGEILTTGGYNTAFGPYALQSAYTSSQKNTSVGYRAGAGYGATNIRHNNTCIGYQAGNFLTTGNNNLLLGYNVGATLADGSNNIIIGYDLDASATDISNELNIGGVYKGDTSSLAATLAGSLTITTIAAAENDLGKFLVSDSGLIKYRTGAQVLADLSGDAGAAFNWNSQNLTSVGTINGLTLTAAETGFTIAGGTTPKTLTLNDNFNVSTQLAAIGANTDKVTCNFTNVQTALGAASGAVDFNSQNLTGLGTLASASGTLTIAGTCSLPALDGQTLQIDGINSDGGAFSFATSDDITFNHSLILPDGGSIGVADAFPRLEFDSANDWATLWSRLGVGTGNVAGRAFSVLSPNQIVAEVVGSAPAGVGFDIRGIHASSVYSGFRLRSGVAGSTQWWFALHVADSSKFKIGTGTSPGAGTPLMTILTTGEIGFGGVDAPAAQLHIDQSSTTAAIPVLTLDQADESEGTIDFIASARGVITGATDSTESVRVELNGTVYRLALYADA